MNKHRTEFHSRFSRRWLWLSLAITTGLLSTQCVQRRARGPLISEVYRDNFDRESLGADWNATSPTAYSIRNGALRVVGARNHPLWLRRRLPRNVRIEFDAWSTTNRGDIKCEVFGDGESFATQDSYTATSYVFIHGGWFNTKTLLARMNEHDDGNNPQAPHVRVVPNRRYHWVIERRGSVITWSIDGEEKIRYTDPQPLAGEGHEYFAFNNWEVELGFDNLVITPL